MILADFAYHRPATLVEACELGRAYGDKARYLAGGTDVLVDLRRQRFVTERLISLAGVPGLSGTRVVADSLHIGPMTTIEDVARAADVKRVLPTLCTAAGHIGSVQIRNRATIGGNFCGAVPCADTPPVCIAAGAKLRIAGVSGERTVPAYDFFLGPRESVLQPGEVLIEIVIPAQPESSGTSYQRFALRHGSALAVASVAARVVVDEGTIKECTVVLGAVAPIPLQAVNCSSLLRGQVPSDELFARAGSAAALEARPISDIRGSAEFRRGLVRVLTVRALREAIKSAGASWR